MASSSIEVMGMGNDDIKVMLLDDNVHDDEMAQRMQEIIHSTGPPGHIIDTGPRKASITQMLPPGQEEEFASIEQFPTIGGMDPPPGTIIFSPQDLVRTTRPAVRGGRGRGKLSTSIPSIKQESNAAANDNTQLEVPVACEICGKVMMTGKTLVQHMAIHSDLKPFQCPHCPKSFARKVHLQGHLVVHGIEKQFECPVCHQRFSRQDCVKVHMRLHDKSKCVYCDVCHKAFLTVGALNIHLRIHRGEKPFKCHLCSKCFTQKNHLITHIKRHTKVTDEHFTKKLGPRMFKCEHCTRAFIRLSDYERHVQWNHGAVADGSVVDKLPTVGNLLDGEMKQTGLPPQIFKAPRDALQSNKSHRQPRKSRKVQMCTTSTQTDDDGGHVIIPRKYQGQVSAGTQVSAPPTPRHDEDMYGDDIFDEGMDRNYSSDEDEEDPKLMDSPEEKKVFSTASIDTPSDPVQDAAFDAIVQGAPNRQFSELNHRLEENEETNNQHAEFLNEVVSSINKQNLDVREADQVETGERSEEEDEARMEIIENEGIREAPPPIQQDDHDQQQIPFKASEVSSSEQEQEVVQKAIAENIEMMVPNKEPVPVRPRGRPRGRGRGSRGRKHILGLTGAAELRFIRKSMMMSILNASNEEKMAESASAEESENVAEEAEAPMEEGETEGRGKRMAKKQHGKDFVCNMKNCDTCVTSPKPNAKVQMKTKVKLKDTDSPVKRTLPEDTNSPQGGGFVQSNKSEAPLSKGWGIYTDYNAQAKLPKVSEKIIMQHVAKKIRLDKDSDEKKRKVDNRVGSYPVDITATPLGVQSQKSDFFVATSKDDTIVSPPVELMSFCIPTYSCKLCGREFRFEGKLHRHIESVHQNKAIFSEDVKPGRGSTKYTVHTRVVKIDDVLNLEQQEEEHTAVVMDENPEIAALRSEWDDDDDDNENDVGKPVVSNTIITSVPSFSQHQPITIVTSEITPMTTSITGSYSSGVKVNMNKLAGLLPQNKTVPVTSHVQARQNTTTRVTTSVAHSSHAPREPETIMADTLDMKCRRLLEKLFNHDLLLSCGLLEEHVSVVLGRVLQHYGVKMIEDYGQGQYEVLKYNLWRLIEWKVTMEQMEEFYTAGKSVEEMMDDIMNERVPLVSHHFVPNEQKANPPPQVSQAPTQVTQMEAVEMADGQMVLQQVAGVLGGQLNLPEGVTQVVLAQDMSPDLLQGAHIVTIDPATGQVLSQVTADQVILTDAIGDELEQQVAALDGQVVVSQAHITDQNVSQGSIVVPQTSTISVHGGQPLVSHGQVIVQSAPSQQQSVKVETTTSASQQQHSSQHQQQ